MRPTIWEEINSINQKCAKEQQENMKEALSGYKKAEKLSKHTEEKAITLPSTTLCEKCRKPLFTEPLIVYPCSHVLHQNQSKPYNARSLEKLLFHQFHFCLILHLLSSQNWLV